MGTSLRGSARTRRTAAWVILADWATVEGKATSAELKNHNFEKRTPPKKRVLTKEDCETPTKGPAVGPIHSFKSVRVNDINTSTVSQPNER